ncbi:hypothetical protein HDU76_000442 [Blyttiomyces sp. JEL0837]|nr:hypothetical protein HDU76_000442 [Blyttiomyces sp. JEL0837]
MSTTASQTREDRPLFSALLKKAEQLGKLRRTAVYTPSSAKVVSTLTVSCRINVENDDIDDVNVNIKESMNDDDDERDIDMDVDEGNEEDQDQETEEEDPITMTNLSATELENRSLLVQQTLPLLQGRGEDKNQVFDIIKRATDRILLFVSSTFTGRGRIKLVGRVIQQPEELYIMRPPGALTGR